MPHYWPGKFDIYWGQGKYDMARSVHLIIIHNCFIIWPNSDTLHLFWNIHLSLHRFDLIYGVEIPGISMDDICNNISPFRWISLSVDSHVINTGPNQIIYESFDNISCFFFF